MNDFPRIFTFYSFKGGVGRSMAVLNVAYALAGRGRNVLVLDMDLEAPGLSGFLRRHHEIGPLAPRDILDLVQWAVQSADLLQAGEKLDRAALPPLTDYVSRVLPDKLDPMRPDQGELGCVHVIPVDEDRDNYSRLTALGIGRLDQDALRQVGSLLHAWLKSREFEIETPDYYGPDASRTAKYDYVLVDSRTGVTEVGGLCIGPLSEHLLVFVGLNDQNIAGTKRFLQEVGVLAHGGPNLGSDWPVQKEIRLDPKPTMVIASPVPSGELEAKRERLDELGRKVGSVVGRLSYHPQLALMETIFVRDFPQEYLALEYQQLVDEVMNQAGDLRPPDLYELTLQLRRADKGGEESQPASRLVRFIVNHPGEATLVWLLFKRDFRSVREEQVFVRLDRICRILSGTSENRDYDMVVCWGDLLAEWALRTTEPGRRALLVEAAMGRFAEVIGSPSSSEREKAYALDSRGWQRYRQSHVTDAIADFRQAIEIDDDYVNARGNLAVALLVSGQTDEATTAFEAALARADAKQVADMQRDLDEAILEHASVVGAAEIQQRIAARRAELSSGGEADGAQNGS
ncbi:MAG: tetratricopeptide repeat protein [Pirellulaceae bacterium]|nr:tetratricopeptide repeat protein [Pirellulaceae bacterium]